MSIGELAKAAKLTTETIRGRRAYCRTPITFILDIEHAAWTITRLLWVP